jgi:hypothetical protein
VTVPGALPPRPAPAPRTTAVAVRGRRKLHPPLRALLAETSGASRECANGDDGDSPSRASVDVQLVALDAHAILGDDANLDSIARANVALARRNEGILDEVHRIGQLEVDVQRRRLRA